MNQQRLSVNHRINQVHRYLNPALKRPQSRFSFQAGKSNLVYVVGEKTDLGVSVAVDVRSGLRF